MVAGLVAMIVYEKLGVRILQRAWFNFDLAWAIALIVTGFANRLPLTTRARLCRDRTCKGRAKNAAHLRKESPENL